MRILFSKLTAFPINASTSHFNQYTANTCRKKQPYEHFIHRTQLKTELAKYMLA